MTTDTELWAIGRAVQRAMRDSAIYCIYQHRDNSNDQWTVRTYEAAAPRNFVRRYTVDGKSSMLAAVHKA